jgi:hypothetical protein
MSVAGKYSVQVNNIVDREIVLENISHISS